MAKLELPTNPRLAGQVLQAHVDERAKNMERGFMGWLFGMSAEKPGNVAAFAFIASAAMFLLIYFGPSAADFPKSNALGIIGSVFTGSIGFLFGRSGR
jgi:hypothetical protein